MVLEEAAAASMEILVNAVIPVLSVKSSALLCVTTPEEDQNAFMTMVREAESKMEKGYITKINLTLMCNRCRESGNLQCPHALDVLPSWRSLQRHEMARDLMEVLSASAFAREMMAISSTAANRMYTDAVLRGFAERRFQSQPGYHTNRDVEFIYIYVDPSMGGPCEYAIVAVYFTSLTTIKVRSSHDAMS